MTSQVYGNGFFNEYFYVPHACDWIVERGDGAQALEQEPELARLMGERLAFWNHNVNGTASKGRASIYCHG